MLIKIKSLIKSNSLLVLLIIFGFVIRAVGSSHAFPFIFHPDEPSVIRSALGIRFDPNPKHFDWPHLYFYLNFVVYGVFVKARGLLEIFGLKELFFPYFGLMWRDPLVFYFISRVLSSVFGALTALPVYLSGKELFGRKVGLFAALAILVMPYHVWHSHYALIDVPSTFFVAVALWVSIRIYKTGIFKYYLLAGLFIGLAASTKYNGGLAAVVVALAHMFYLWGALFSKKPNQRETKLPIFIRKLFEFRSIRNIVSSGLAAVFGFLLGTPYALIDFDTFVRKDSPVGAFWQFENVGKVGFTTQLVQFFDSLFIRLPENVGYTFMGVFVVAVILAFLKLFKRQANLSLWLCLLPAVFLIFYISGFSKTRSHYFFMAYPFISVVVAFYAEKVLSGLAYRKLAVFAVSVVFIVPLIFSMYQSVLMVRKDTRVLMYEWMLENVKESNKLVHNKSSFEEIMDKFSNNESSKDITKSNIQGHSGYIFQQIDENENDMLEMNKKEFELLQNDNIRFVKSIKPVFRTGPLIHIYAFY